MSAARDHALRIDPETGATLPCSCGAVPTGFKNAPTGKWRGGRPVVAPEIVWGPDPSDLRTRDGSGGNEGRLNKSLGDVKETGESLKSGLSDPRSRDAR